MTTCVIECVGGGAGGNGMVGTASFNSIGGGGGSGAYARKSATASLIGASQVVTVGAGGGGGGGVSGSAGSAGGDTSVGSVCIAKGAPSTGNGYTSGSGGPSAGCVGDFIATGASGKHGVNASPGSVAVAAGAGGDSHLGPGAPPTFWTVSTAIIGATALGYGGGGGGSSIFASGAVGGGIGSPGLVVITEYGMIALNAGSAGNVRYDTPQSLTSAQASQARSNIAVTKRNFLINGAFQINQGGYVSAAVLAAAAYGHDQWKAGAAGGDYSFTQSAGSTTITIAAGKSLIQPIEDVRVTGGGNYVLAWTGTAQARAGVNTLTPAGSYAASPLLITGQTDGTVMSVEFNVGTLGNVGLYEGTVAPPFQMPDYASELAACQRYYYRRNYTIASTWTSVLQAYATTQASGPIMDFPAQMRAAPTVSAQGTFSLFSAAGTPFAISGGTYTATPDFVYVAATIATAALVAGNAVLLAPTTVPAAYVFNARL